MLMSIHISVPVSTHMSTHRPLLARTNPLPRPGRLHISLTRCSFALPCFENLRLTEYNDVEEVGEALLCSGCIPFFLNKDCWPRVFRGQHIFDGGITDNTPVFRDGTKRAQLVVRFDTLRDGIIYYSEAEIIELVERGIFELASLVRAGRGGLVPKNLTLIQSDGEYLHVHRALPGAPDWLKRLLIKQS